MHSSFAFTETAIPSYIRIDIFSGCRARSFARSFQDVRHRPNILDEAESARFRQSATEIGPFSVDKRMAGAPLPYSMRRCSSSHVFRASEQMLAWQLTGERPLDSTKKLEWKPEGTRRVNGPLTASATNSEPFQ